MYISVHKKYLGKPITITKKKKEKNRTQSKRDTLIANHFLNLH